MLHITTIQYSYIFYKSKLPKLPLRMLSPINIGNGKGQLRVLQVALKLPKLPHINN